jgi:hypothetical protein
MMTRNEQIRYAILAWDFALALSIGSVLPGPERAGLMAAREKPNLNTIRAVLAIGRHVDDVLKEDQS